MLAGLSHRDCYARIHAWLIAKLRSAPAELGETRAFVEALPDPEVAEEADLDFVFGEVISGQLETYFTTTDGHGVRLSEYAEHAREEWRRAGHPPSSSLAPSRQRSRLFQRFGPREEVCRPRKQAHFLYPARKGDRWGYVDQDGREATSFEFLAADAFSLAEPACPHGKASVGSTWRAASPSWTRGRLFDQVLPFHGGRAMVSFVRKPAGFARHFGFVDETGMVVVEGLENARDFSEGRASVDRLEAREGGWEYIDRSGRTVLPGPYPIADEFSEGLARVLPRQGPSITYINAAGEVVVAVEGYSGEALSEGLAAVHPAGGFGYIDRSGRLVIDDPANGLVERF